MNSGQGTVWACQRTAHTYGIGGILGGTFPSSCAQGAVSGGGGLPFTILRKLAKAAVAASYDVFSLSDGLRRVVRVNTTERDRGLAT